MNDVVFVMANSRLKKKKDVRKTKDYNMDDLASDDEWTVEENEASSSLDASYEELLLEVGENEDASRGGGVAPMDHLEVPPIVDNDQGPKGEDIDENEDAMEDNDDYPTFDMKEFLG